MKKSLLIFIAALIPILGFSQRFIGISTSNWSATNGLYLNPANIADSRTKFSIDLLSLNFGTEFNAGVELNDVQKYFGSDNSDLQFSDIIKVNDSKDGQYSLMLPYLEIRGPGAMISINRKHSVALTTRVRAMHQFNNFSEKLFNTLTDSNFNEFGQNSFKSQNFNWTAHIWSEIGLSYGGVIWEQGMHQVKGGITLRYLQGAGYTSIVSENLDGVYSYNGSDAQMQITNSDINIQRGGIFGTDEGFSDLGGSIGKSLGSGFSADIGFVYEYRPDYAKYKYDIDGKEGVWDNSKNKYKFRFSAAMTDMGSIKYKDNNKGLHAFNTGTSSQIKGSEIFDKISDFDSLRTFLGSKGINVNDTTKATEEVKVYLPRMLVLNADYHAVKNFYINAMLMANVLDRAKIGTSHYTQITVTPRWDTKVFSVGLPITYASLSKKLRVGAGVRVGGFFFGSDDMLSMFSSTKYGTNFYFGASIPIAKKRIKDSDGDGISNKKDKCPNEKGVAEMNGCPDPDKDGDGVLDKDDKCPDVAGSKTAAGCPDADLDGVADAEDRCPQESGSIGLQGCPDRDKDGIADIDDACPDVAGLAQYKGCPDTDTDGIPDNEDECPNDAGPIANQGCPDTDNDGIADNKDKCPNVPGTAANSGCPEVSVEVKKRLAFAATAIQFDLGKSSIKKSSNKLLDEIVQILNDYPDYNMTIEGHTDKTGNSERNLELSKERAASVKDYFISQGIAASRLISDGFGDTKPVESNKTAKGRAKNRRVELDLKLK